MSYKDHQIVDLTQELYDGQPVFVGHPETKVWPCMTHEESARSGRFKPPMSYQAKVLQLCEHGPTHVDSISHIDPRPGAPTVDRMGFDFFYASALAVDFEGVPDKGFITRAMVEERLRHYGLRVEPGDTVLYTYGHHRRHYPRPEYCTHYAGLDRGAAEYIYGERGALNIGTDAPSVDSVADNAFPCHVVCRELQRTNTENLCNIEEVVGKRFLYIGLPLKIRGGTGSPIRAVAVLGA